MLGINCLKRWGQEFYGSVERQAPSLSKITALFLTHRFFIIALAGAAVVGIVWKFYKITPLTKVEKGILNRTISPMAADFLFLKKIYDGLLQKIPNWERLKSKTHLADDHRKLFVAILTALSPSASESVKDSNWKKELEERSTLVISVLKILQAPEASSDKEDKLRRIKQKVRLTEEEEKILGETIQNLSAHNVTCVMNLLISKQEAKGDFSSVKTPLIETFREVLLLISFIPDESANFMEDALLLKYEIQDLQKKLQSFSEKYDSIFTTYKKEFQTPNLLKRTKEMTPEIRKGMQQQLQTWETTLFKGLF